MFEGARNRKYLTQEMSELRPRHEQQNGEGYQAAAGERQEQSAQAVAPPDARDRDVIGDIQRFNQRRKSARGRPEIPHNSEGEELAAVWREYVGYDSFHKTHRIRRHELRHEVEQLLKDIRNGEKLQERRKNDKQRHHRHQEIKG